MKGSSSSRPSISASSSRSTSTSRMCWPASSPAPSPAPSPPCSPSTGWPLPPGPWPTPDWRLSPKRKRGSSICGTGTETAWSPRRAISSEVERYLRRSARMRPRTISRKRARSASMRNTTVPLGGLEALGLGLAAREEPGHVHEHLVGRDLVVAEQAHQALADHADLGLRVGGDHGADQARELDRVAPVLGHLELERARQAAVARPVEGAPLALERVHEVHQLVAEVVLAALGDLDLLLDRAHQALVGVAGLGQL